VLHPILQAMHKQTHPCILVGRRRSRHPVRRRLVHGKFRWSCSSSSPCKPARIIHAGSGWPLLLSGRRRRRRGRGRKRDITTEDWTRNITATAADGRSAASDGVEFAVGEHSRGSGFDCAGHRHLLQASADHPSLVRPHWRNALAAPVKRLTGDNPIRHFVMAITVESAHLFVSRRARRRRRRSRSWRRPLSPEQRTAYELAARKMGVANDPARRTKRNCKTLENEKPDLLKSLRKMGHYRMSAFRTHRKNDADF
jgi:hypothetical protein